MDNVRWFKSFVKETPTAMAVKHLPVVGRPTSAPTPLRKIPIVEHFYRHAATLFRLPR